MDINNKSSIPADGLAGLKAYFKSDVISGFIVFLLALPLSLGIAKASDFPPIMGLISAIIGGLVVSFFMGSKLTIKGPAAGLIVIVCGAVSEFGQGDAVLGWKLALGAMVISGLLQVLFGIFKWGKFVDIFPISAIHGMLAAIGIIIIAKQIPILFNDNPLMAKGMSPIELIVNIPKFILALDPKASLIGVLSLMIMLFWKHFSFLKMNKIPAPLVVLLLAIPMEILMDFEHTEPPYALVQIGSLVENLGIHVSFAGFSEIGLFLKYVIMFALVGTLESLLTVKAIDSIDPFHRKSDANKDLIAVGIGNTISAILGGLPMIAEVARSSANVSNGAVTRWSNFFHGFFILVFVLLAAPLLEMIPNAALAAMLISVGIKLAHPREFINTYRIGKEQLAIFFITVVVTLLEDLLLGIAAGIILKMVIHFFRGTTIKSFFKADLDITEYEDHFLVQINESAVFSNYIGIENKISQIPKQKNIIINFQNANLIDHSVMENLIHFKHNYELIRPGQVTFSGFDFHEKWSNHPLSGRHKKKRH